jgi:ribulose-phosphate 3-epimerase
MNPIIVAPSILAADFGQLSNEIQSVQNAGADWLHIDVMDGSFVPPITFGANMVEAAKRSCTLPLDVHLMIRSPELHIETFKKAGANRVTVHQEVCPHLHRVLGSIRAAGMKSGACVNPGTPVETLFPVLELCDLVLVMTVNPGWGGQEFIPSTLAKIGALSQEIKRQGVHTLIEVDGGIQSETAKKCSAQGASVMVAGSSIFGAKDRRAAIQSLR